MTTQLGEPMDQARAALERFVVDNDELLQLEARIGRFNVFDALGIANREIHHSYFLAFILDPAESHGQSQLFLRAVLMDLLKVAPPHLRPFSPVEIDRADLRGIVVRREWENIDLLITCEEPRFVVAFENKIASGEHSNQLSRYRSTIDRQFPTARKMCVFLTASGTEPSERDWVSYSYRELYQVLRRVRSTYSTSIGDDIRLFLDHYLNLLGTRFMNDKEIDKLCAQIYKNHRQALDLILARISNPASGTLGEVNATVEQDAGRWEVFYTESVSMDFAPSDWSTWMPKLSAWDDYATSWLALRFYIEGGALFFHLALNRMKQTDRRTELAERLTEYLEKSGFRKRQANKIKDDWMQLSGREKVFDWGEGEPQPEALRQAVQGKLDEVHAKLQGVKAVVEGVLGRTTV